MSHTISNANELDLRINPPIPVRQKIYLYVLRNTSTDEKFKIKAYFNNDIKYTFNRLEALDDQAKISPYVYRTELDLVIDNQGRLFVSLQDGFLPIRDYRLRLSRKIFNIDSTFRDYNDDKDRSIDTPYSMTHYFIFDVDFAKNLMDSPPGYNVSFWNQLYVYTFYILRQKMYEVFDILITRFQICVQQYKRILIREEFNDFFQGCLNHLRYAMSTTVNQYLAEKILIRMTGILPITKTNFDLTNRDTINFALALISDIKEHYDSIFATITVEEWPTFRDGLVLYLSIELLSQSKDTMNLIHQMKNKECQKDLANVLLRRLEVLQRPVLGLNWTDLFTLVDPDILTLQQLELTKSIQTYITSLVQIVGMNTNEMEISEKIIRHFDQLIYDERLPVNLENIIYLLKFLQVESTETEERPKNILKIINTAIESSIELRKKIKQYLYALKISIEQFPNIQFLISCISHSIILYNISKRDLLMNLIMHANALYSYEFFKQWFYSFLLFNDEMNEINKKDYQDLLQHWSNQFIKSHEITMKIFRDIDLFIDAFKNHQYQLIFIHHMIQLCFRQGSIYRVLAEGLINVQTALFLEEFKKQFALNYLNISQDRLKQLSNHENPLYHFLNISKQIPHQSQLINQLIHLTTNKIQFNTDEILRDTFEKPTRTTCIYAILFEDCLTTSTLRQIILDQLLAIWNTWEERGFRANQITGWKNFSPDERQIVHRIWNYVGEQAKKQYQIDTLIAKQQLEMDEKILIQEKITKCLEIYCRNSCDKEKYLHCLLEVDAQLKSGIVRAIVIPNEIKILLPMADRLNPLEKLHAWKTFLAESRKNSTEINSPDIMDDDSLLSDGRETSETSLFSRGFRRTVTSKSSENVSLDQRSCIDILNEDIQILDSFIDRLKKICSEWEHSPISYILDLFPDIQYVDHDFEILEPLIQSDDIMHLKSILDYWKSRDYITHICHGCVNLFTNLDKSSEQICATVKTIPGVNDQTEGGICLLRYQRFSSTFLQGHSKELLNFLSQYSLSNDLIIFLNLLALTDVDNLLQAVNDWDETLINTKTILDLVVLKRFFMRFNEEMESTKSNPFLSTLDHIEAVFEKIFEDEQFKNLFNCFETCSASLTSIKRIHLELTDKELSKRNRISDLMRNITFHFIQQSNQFNIDIQPQSMCINDLTELRDRARLIEYSRNNNKFPIDSERDIKELHLFVTFVEIVEKILKNLSLLNIAGHPSIIKYLSPNKSFTCINSDYKKLIEFSLMLDNLHFDWEIHLCQMYEKHLDLTYFSYQQFWIIEDYFYHQISSLDQNHSGYHLLQYIGIQPEKIQVEYLPTKRDNPNERLENIGKILSAQRIKTNLTFKQENRHIKKVYLVETSDEGILRSILSLFHNLHNTISVNHVFYCTEETSWMEIRAFTYRCFYSQTLHQLIRPELLSASTQDHFTRLLRQLIDQYPQHYFRLGIITTVSNTHLQLINGLRTLQIVHTIHDQDMLNKTDLEQIIKEFIADNSTLITSRINGLGKSYFIKTEIEKKHKRYIKFPISGDIDVDTIAERLCQYGNELSSAALHIDIGAINNIKQLNELLYCLLLFRSFRFGQVAVYIPTDVPIYIELDSSPYSLDLYEKINLFKYMNTKYIDHIDWNEFTITNPTAIQLVVNYLQAINNKSILKKNITEENVINFDPITCINLLKEPFLQNKNPEFVTWTQLVIFISVYYSLFSGFSRCGFFLVEAVPNPQLRYDILQSLLQSSNQFTSLCVDDVRKNQRSVNTNEANLAFSEAIVRWDKTQPFTIVFSADDNPIFVYKKPTNVPLSLVQAFRFHYQALTGHKDQDLDVIFPDYSRFFHVQFFQKLASLSKKYFNKAICIKCYSQYQYDQTHCIKCEAKEILFRPASWKTEDTEKFQEFIAERIRLEYVLTPDNYIKMLLIYLRVQSGLPVLIMGETGCGKTALIQFLCQKILDDEMEVFRIHAGVTSKEIIKRINKYSRKAYECLEQNKRLWVFLDEFNTTPNIGLIKEITCERTLLGKPLPDNMVLLGACNPQRRKKEKKISDNNIGIKKDLYEMQRLKDSSGISLLYTVVPIPETMLEYVWDYGYLDDDIETKYIRTMLNTCEQLGQDVTWFDHIVLAISKSQKFFRELEDVSSVSLRDVARFCRLYNWFRKSILKRESVERFLDNSSVLVRRSSLLALLLCYYFRLDSPHDRKNYIDQIEDLFKSVIINITKVPNFLIKILEMEQKKLIERMELPAGTAKNRALMDNIFVLLVCIINRIPVIICGKPGCSKTSAIQIVISNLKGKKSSDEYFQQLPELITVSYQGSQNCTSESIKKVFQRADKYLNVKSNTDILPVIVFDEIGLAELSPHNPLKVLHSKLEVETCQYGFVGLSNWRLDASKMNRTLYLSCPDPDIADLKLTAQIISDSIVPLEGQLTRIDPAIIEGLAVSYYDLYEVLKNQQDQQKYTNYFGLRDFYSLIKGVVNDLIKSENEYDSYECILRQLIINFDGILNGSQFMWNRFCEHIHRKHLIEQYKSPTFKQLLDQRLTSRHGRYLMLIAENESVIDYVERYILVKHQPPPVRTLIGSCFSGDLISGRTYTEQYNYRVLMDIILYAETNVTLIMRRMGHLYDNLYDLFNQNFSICGKKKYCRIALGALYHPRCLVNDEFYCVVFVRKEDLVKCDPPFLNRFEKHLIDMKSLVHERHWLITDQLLTELTALVTTNVNKYFPLLQHLFVDYSIDYICHLVIDAFDYLNLSIDDDQNTSEVIDYCKKKLIRTSSFDLPLILSLQSDQCHPLIDQYYQIHTNLTFQSVIQQAFNEKVLTNQIIYTYTQIYHIIHYESTEIEEVKLSIFKTELELTNKIKRHYQKTDPHRLLIIRVDYHQEHEHILLLKHILLNSNIQSTNRSVWLIFHLQRHMFNQTINEVLFNGWSTLMINDLNENKLIPKEILLNPSYINLVTHPYFLLSECMFDELIDRCLTKFRYTVSRKDQMTQINLRRNQIIENLTITIESQSLRSIIHEHLFKLIGTISLARFSDWRKDLLTNGILIGTCRSFNDALQSTISIYYENYLLLLFSHLEKYSFIDSFLFLNTINPTNDFLKKIWFDCLTSTLQTIDPTIINVDVIEMPLIFHLHLPCAMTEYEVIRLIRQIIIQRRADEINENDLTNLAIKQLHTKSIYGSNMEMILNEKDLFHYYYHDQLVLAQEEAKIYQLSSEFIQRLILTNPKRSIVDRLRLLLIDYNELFEIFRLFEISTKLIEEKEFSNEVFNRQFLIFDENEQRNIKNESLFYNLILTSEHFCLIPPKTEMSDEHIFQCDGDPFIEVSLMNLIEFLVSPSIIDRIDNIEQLTTTYSLVAQSIISLTHYSVNNLEKLRSFISLIRCITTLIPTNKALDVFKQACRYAFFDATFQTCDDIHRFIHHLQRIISTNAPNTNELVIQRTLLKLESEFLKNWLVDHSEEYLDIITLMSKSDNNLWQYSAKIFTYIDRKLQLLPMIKEFHGQLPSIEDHQRLDENLRELTNKYQQLDEHLHQLNDFSRKIEHIMITRLHMHLILSVDDKETIETILAEEFPQFEENLRVIQNTRKDYGLTLISLISWLKYYAQLYAFVLINDSHHQILEDIDKLLTRDDFLFCSTIKLFIIKQFCQMSSINLDNLRDIIKNRNVTWIRPMIALPTGQKTQETRHSLILPTPLFECRTEFLRVDRILTDHIDLNEIRQLIHQCQIRQDTFYCFLIWFIHYYARFYLNNELSVINDYQQLIETDLSKEIIDCFELIGYKFLVFLCTNFNKGTYFSLHSQMTMNELHQRLLALNIIALLLSYKTLSHISYFSSLLFNGNLKMPQNYADHLQSSVCLPGLISSNPIITQMIDVRTTVKERLDQGQIYKEGKYIFRCSEDCLWMFYFVNCGIPVDRSQCPLCKKEIGATQYGVLIQRTPPQIQIPIEEGFQFINNYIEQYNKTPRYGYHNQTSATLSNEYEKSDHLNRPITYRFLHMITHAVLLFLDELSLLSDLDLKNRSYFREHFEKDYALLSQQSTDHEQCYIWLYKLLNHLINKDFLLKGYMNSNEKVIQLEKLIEEKLIFNHIDSIADEINQYKIAYAEYIRQRNEEATIDDFVQEICQEKKKYPLLDFFNVTNIYTSNPINEFRIRLQNIPFGEKLYPVTTFLMKRLRDYANIQYLYPIITFTNYLIEKFNHRIKRNDASETPISYYLTHGSDCETISRLYKDFLHAWFQLNLNEVRYGCQTTKFEITSTEEDFARNTKLAMLLLNTSKDDSSILLAACLRTCGELQNEIVHFFHNKIVNDAENNRYRENAMPIQSIRPEYILQLDANVISTKLINDGFTINYQYGKSKDIIYDYEEIEITLRNMIGCLPLIDTEKLRFLNYQFELYSENTSLINDVRKRIKQESLKENERIKLKNLINSMQNDDILHYLGSLDYVFTYLRNIDDETTNNSITIQTFVEKYIRTSACLNDNVLQRPPFATINLKYIIDLYELIEESAFDQVLRHYIKQNLTEEFFSMDQRKTIIKQFGDLTYKKETISPILENIHAWIGILKRLMVRVLSNVTVSLDVPIQIYLERTDLWTGDISEGDLQTFELPDDILLQHTYLILKGLENERDKTVSTNLKSSDVEETLSPKNLLQNVDAQSLKVEAWHNKSIANASMIPRVIKKNDKPSINIKMRV